MKKIIIITIILYFNIITAENTNWSFRYANNEYACEINSFPNEYLQYMLGDKVTIGFDKYGLVAFLNTNKYIIQFYATTIKDIYSEKINNNTEEKAESQENIETYIIYNAKTKTIFTKNINTEELNNDIVLTNCTELK